MFMFCDYSLGEYGSSEYSSGARRLGMREQGAPVQLSFGVVPSLKYVYRRVSVVKKLFGVA
jgi:hypothetical protein